MPDLHEDEPQPRRRFAGPMHLAETDDRLMWLLHVAANEWGPLGVALTAALMSDPDAVVRELVVAGSAEPIGRKRLRAILAGRPGPLQTEAPLGVVQYPDGSTTTGYVAADAEVVDEAADDNDRPEYLMPGPVEVEFRKGPGPYVAPLVIPETFLPTPEHPAAIAVPGRGVVEYDGRSLTFRPTEPLAARATTDQTGRPLPDEPALPPLEEEPRRPRLDHFPHDALLLTYREVRQLLALHIEAVADSIMSASGQARAMREGETPLRLSEVLDR